MIQNNSDLIAFFQSIHILALSAVFMAMLVFNIRLITGRLSDEAFLSGFKYNAVIGLPVLLITGVFLIIAEPARSLANDAFQLKMVLLAIVLLLYRYLGRFAMPTVNFSHKHVEVTLSKKFLALLSILIWIGIVFAGRWIAYL